VVSAYGHQRTTTFRRPCLAGDEEGSQGSGETIACGTSFPGALKTLSLHLLWAHRDAQVASIVNTRLVWGRVGLLGLDHRLGRITILAKKLSVRS
jgi:hypothetical protein